MQHRDFVLICTLEILLLTYLLTYLLAYVEMKVQELA